MSSSALKWRFIVVSLELVMEVVFGLFIGGRGGDTSVLLLFDLCLDGVLLGTWFENLCGFMLIKLALKHRFGNIVGATGLERLLWQSVLKIL